MTRGPRLPLSFVVGRYFVYLLVGAALTVGLPILAFGLALGRGTVLPANYGEQRLEETVKAVAAQASFDGSTLPSSYRYAHLTATGDVLGTDLAAGDLEAARSLVISAEGQGMTDTSSLAVTWERGAAQRGFRRDDGTWCVLLYDLTPQWADRAQRDSWPNPQDLMTWSILVSTVVLVVFVALRASRVLTRKMAPLARAADAVGAGDLDFTVGTSNVAQVDDVLCAMERMRASLRGSLEEQWAAEARRREEVAALAHDLKTPLTVIRGNAELLGEDAAAGSLGPEQAACAEAIRRAALETDAFVAGIIRASRGQDEARRAPVDVAELVSGLAERALELATACGLELVSAPFEPPRARPSWDAPAVRRAVMNLVGNACDHARSLVSLAAGVEGGRLTLTVADDGPGFSPAALEHGRERLFRDDVARGGGEGHFGLGLSIADEVARAHGGSLELFNRASPDGSETGAVARLALPLDGS